MGTDKEQNNRVMNEWAEEEYADEETPCDFML